MDMAGRPGAASASDLTRVLLEVPFARPSLRARLLALFLRLFVRPILARTHDLPRLRERVKWFDHLLPSRGPNTVTGQLAGRDAEFFAAPEPRRVLLYLHGGGFCFSSTRAHSAFLIRLSLELDAVGVMPKYRLSPEHPFPAGLDDCVGAYKTLIGSGVDPRSIVVAGDSAGGNLVLSTLMSLRDAGTPLPGCAVMISPGLDLTGIGTRESHIRNGASDAVVPLEALPRLVKAYAGACDPGNIRLSPLHGEFGGLVPMHFVVSDAEVLRDESWVAAAKAHRAGLEVELRLWPGMVHCFPVFQWLPEARAARADIVRFVKTHTVEHVTGVSAFNQQLF